MIITVAEKVLSNPTWHSLLDVIVILVEESNGLHSFDISQYKEMVESAWLAGATGVRLSIPASIKGSAKSATRALASNAVTLKIDERSPLYGIAEEAQRISAHPLGAITILLQPLHLIVEDESSDGAFILWISRLLGLDTIRRAYDMGRLLFRHAGGKNQMEKSARALSFGIWPRKGKPIRALSLRAIAMLDSDARYPGDTPNAAIVARVRQYVAFVHQLERRTIENYVPKKYFHRRFAGTPNEPAIEPYYRMTELQRSHFPIKKGFVDSSRPPQPQGHTAFLTDTTRTQAERDHFSTVDAADWSRFSAGFGEQLASVFSEESLRCEPNEKGQLSADAEAELRGFLNAVIRYL